MYGGATGWVSAPPFFVYRQMEVTLGFCGSMSSFALFRRPCHTEAQFAENAMWKQNVFTVIVSVVLSVSATLLVERNLRPVLNDTVRVRKLELIDEHGEVRGLLEVQRIQGGEQQPQLILNNDKGEPAIALGLDPHSRGYLSFGAPEYLGSVLTVGYLTLDDTVPHSPSFTGWGLTATSPKSRRSTVMGVSDAGGFLGLSTLRTPDPNDPSQRSKTQ